MNTRERRSWLAGLLLAVVCAAGGRIADAHPAPFSYLDVTVTPDRLSGTIVLHAIDVARTLDLPDPSVLASQDVVTAQADGIVTLVTTRVAVEADGTPITWVIDRVEPMASQDAVGIAWHATLAQPAGHLGIGARLFPEDPVHQTFVTVYESGRVTWQEVLNANRVRADHYTGTRQGYTAVLRRFIASGIHHIAIGPDHILFLVGLLLPGGSLRRLLLIVTAFTLGHSITLALATLSGAQALGVEGETGSLTKGKYADFAVVEVVPGRSGVSPEMEVLEAAAGGGVAATAVGGELAYDRVEYGTAG